MCRLGLVGTGGCSDVDRPSTPISYTSGRCLVHELYGVGGDRKGSMVGIDRLNVPAIGTFSH